MNQYDRIYNILIDSLELQEAKGGIKGRLAAAVLATGACFGGACKPADAPATKTPTATTHQVETPSKKQAVTQKKKAATPEVRAINPHTGKRYEGEWDDPAMEKLHQEAKMKKATEEADKRFGKGQSGQADITTDAGKKLKAKMSNIGGGAGGAGRTRGATPETPKPKPKKVYKPGQGAGSID